MRLRDITDSLEDGISKITQKVDSIKIRQTGNVVKGDLVGGNLRTSRVWIDGEEVDQKDMVNLISINITGNVKKVDTQGSVEIKGNVLGNVNTQGKVEVSGHVGGRIDTQGRVACGDVAGDINTMGLVECGTVAGKIDTMDKVVINK